MSNDDLERYFDGVYEKKGTLDLDYIHDDVARPNHPLHDRYEWDDTVAGREYRKQQIARDIRTIERVYVGDEGEAASARAYLNNREIGRGRRGYSDAREVLKDPETLEHLRQSMELEIRSFRRRYGELEGYAAALLREATEAAEARRRKPKKSSGSPRSASHKRRAPR